MPVGQGKQRSNMDFTKQEIDLLKRITSTGKWEHIIWETVYLVPSIALILFGTIEESKRSIFVGAGLLVMIRTITTFQQSKSLNVLNELCTKIYAQLTKD
jgi:hypothetical protein